jgi:hypothetical protein
MPRPFRRLPALVAAAALAAALAAGCSPRAPSSSSSSSASASASSSSATGTARGASTRPALPGRAIVVDGVTVTVPWLSGGRPPAADVPADVPADVAADVPASDALGANTPPSAPAPLPVDTVDVVPVVADGGEHPSLAPPPPVAPVVEAPSRARRRMDLEQLDAAFVAATGGLSWTENGVNQWQALAPTLGRPDFLTSTEEDLTPSLLFQKFLGDAARKTCSDLFTREASTPAPQRVFFVGLAPDERSAQLGARLDANLQRLLLRFHGRDTRQPGTEGALDGWRWLWLSVEHLESPRTAWMATCVALIEHPDFYTY